MWQRCGAHAPICACPLTHDSDSELMVCWLMRPAYERSNPVNNYYTDPASQSCDTVSARL